MSNMAKVSISGELEPLARLGIKSGISCGITSKAKVEMLAGECDEDIQRLRRYREERERIFTESAEELLKSDDKHRRMHRYTIARPQI